MRPCSRTSPNRIAPSSDSALRVSRSKRLRTPLRHYADLVRLAPEHLEGQRRLASALMTLQRYDEALAPLDVLSHLEPGNPKVLLAMARCLRAVKQWERCVTVLERCVEVTPHAASAWQELRRAWAELGASPRR